MGLPAKHVFQNHSDDKVPLPTGANSRVCCGHQNRFPAARCFAIQFALKLISIVFLKNFVFRPLCHC